MMRPFLAPLFAIGTGLAVLASGPSAFAAGGGGGTGADLQVSGSASTGSPTSSTPFTYTFQVKNSGPAAASAATFTDSLPAGFGYTSALVNRFPTPCSAAAGAGGATAVSCDLGTLASGAQATVDVNVIAPSTAATFANTGTVSSSAADPNLANNSATVTVKTATCALPAGQLVQNGMVTLKYTGINGLFENFQFQVGAVNSLVVTNFYDGTRPLTQVINLNCKTVGNNFIQPGNFVTVVGTPTSAGIVASLIQVPFLFDKL